MLFISVRLKFKNRLIFIYSKSFYFVLIVYHQTCQPLLQYLAKRWTKAFLAFVLVFAHCPQTFFSLLRPTNNNTLQLTRFTVLLSMYYIFVYSFSQCFHNTRNLSGSIWTTCAIFTLASCFNYLPQRKIIVN